MRELIVLIILVVINAVFCNGQAVTNSLKDNDKVNLRLYYQNSTYNFYLPLYKAVANHSNVNFVFSPRSVWIMLAAIAEGSNSETKVQLSKILNLPDDLYDRQMYYQLITSRFTPTYGVDLIETRNLLVDDYLSINPIWLDIVTRNSLLDVITVPIHSYPEYTENLIKILTSANTPKLDFSGNSVMVDTADYSGLWAAAFNDAIVENSPFYNQKGEEIGTVDLMRIKRKAKLGYVKSMNAKVLELPLGYNTQYRMLFAMLLDKKDISSIVKNIKDDILIEVFSSLKESNVPIDIGIPRLEITSEIDMRAVLKDFGITNLWKDPEATKHISTPPAFPSSYVHRATLTFDKYGVLPSPPEQISSLKTETGLDPEVGTDFIGNQPLLFGLFGSEYTPLIAVGFSQPTTYKYGTTYLRELL